MRILLWLTSLKSLHWTEPKGCGNAKRVVYLMSVMSPYARRDAYNSIRDTIMIVKSSDIVMIEAY